MVATGSVLGDAVERPADEEGDPGNELDDRLFAGVE